METKKFDTASTSGVVDAVVDTAKGVAESAADYSARAKDKVQEWASTAGDAMVDAKDKAKEWASTAADQTGEAIKYAGDEATRLIRRYPLQTVLLGIGLGFLLARATRS